MSQQMCECIRVRMLFSFFGHEKNTHTHEHINKQTLFSFTPIHKCKRVFGPKHSRMLCFNILK